MLSLRPFNESRSLHHHSNYLRVPPRLTQPPESVFSFRLALAGIRVLVSVFSGSFQSAASTLKDQSLAPLTEY